MFTSTHLIQKALVVVAFLAVVTAKAEAQTRYKTPLGWKHAAITSVIQHADSIYVSLVGGSVAVFTAEQSFVRYVVELDRYYVEELYEVDGLLVAIGRGDIVAMDDNRAWRSVGRTKARVFVDLDGRILFLEQQKIMQLKRQGSQLAALLVGMCPTPFSDIETFAVVDDTVLVGYAGKSRIDFGLLNADSIGSVQLMLQTEPSQFFICPGSNLYVLASGILFSLRRHPDSVFVPDIVEYDHRYTAFSNAVHARMNDSNRIVGTTILDLLDPQFFLICDDPSSIRPIPELHRYIAQAPVLTMCDSTWLVADAPGKLQRVFADSSATVTPDYDGLDGVVNPTVNSNGVTPPSIVATLMYSDTARSVEFSSQMDEPETLDETIGRIDHYPVCLRSFQDGSRVVVYTDEVLHQASHSAPWTRVYSFTPRLNSAAIPFMNSPTPLLVSNGGNRLHYGTSSGTQWSSSVLRGVRSAISALQSSGNIVAFKSADKIHLLELTGGQDTITGQVFTCGYLKPFAFLSVSDSVVSFAALSSSTDGSPNNTTADRIAYTTWNAADSTVDSVMVNISPVKLGVYKQEYICNLHDTAFVYSHVESRLLAFIDKKLVMDKKLDLSRYRRINDYSIEGAQLSGDGILWIWSLYNNQMLGLDLRSELRTVGVGSSTTHQPIPILVYPNPTSQAVTIELPLTVLCGGALTVSFISEDGRYLDQQQFNQIGGLDELQTCITHDISGFPPGVVIATVSCPGFQGSARFIVTR